MATEIYKTTLITTVDGEEIEISPLKIKYLRLVMDKFSDISKSVDDYETMDIITECVRICLKQFMPEITTKEQVEDLFDLPTIYKILEYAAGIKINKESDDSVQEQAEDNIENSSWENLDLAKLETEAFLMGIWKNFDELEESMSIQELISILSRNRELDYEEKKFLAAIQGVDLDNNEERGQKEWEDLKARVFSRGKAVDSKDVLALQGVNAQKAGFGIGLGLDYEDLRN